MLAYPRQSVHLPLGALNDWGRSGRALGQGVAAAVDGAVELADAMKQVLDTGTKADMAGMLENIARETMEELQEMPVRDWDYSWQKAYAPRVRQMLDQYSGEERERARKMSEALSPYYSMDGRRQMEVNQLHESRRQWQTQVDAAVQRGDSGAARRWMEQGRGVFVPEESAHQQLDKVQSRTLHARWQQQLAQDPFAALAAWEETPPDSRPQGTEELQALEQELQQAREGVFHSLALQLAAGVEQGQNPDAALLDRAVAAGVLSPAQVETARKPQRPLTSADACEWLRRIDEHQSGETEQMAVEIALAPVPAESRRLLLQRLQQSSQLPPQQRRGISRRLWKMYHEGAFGCPGDAEALQCLGRLQEEALQRQTTADAGACEQWLQELQEAAATWLCYQPE